MKTIKRYLKENWAIVLMIAITILYTIITYFTVKSSQFINWCNKSLNDISIFDSIILMAIFFSMLKQFKKH